ncbi:hypothetical protein [Dokdonella sp.]|uniref:hypothetical protein n=1 Tax=Dokdonella sp. TaxID=2291710 RepID=UPI003528B221
MRFLSLALGLLACLFAQEALALDGDADPVFGKNGQIALVRPQQTPGNAAQPTGDLVVFADGRLLWAAPLDDGSVWLGRAWRDGSADPMFGTDGTGRITLPGCGQKRNARLVADHAGGVYLWSSGCLRHVLDDGSLAPGFGMGAMPKDGFSAAELARDLSGRFVLAGREGQQVKVYRFGPNGAADVGFGSDGSVEIDLPSTNGARELNALAVRPDGRILVAGSRGNSSGPNLVVAQLLPSGLPDSAWGDNGLVDLAPPSGFNGLIANAMALDIDGSLVVVGKASNGSNSCCVLVTRLDAGGQVVAETGLKFHQLSGQPSIYPFFEQRDSVVILPNHRILIGSIAFPFSAPLTHRTQYTLIRTFPNGDLDPRFGHDGWNSYTISDPEGLGQLGDYNQMHAIGHDESDGSMVILGRTFFEDNATGNDYVSLVRARFDLIFDGRFD